MDRAQILQTLKVHKSLLQAKFGVKKLALFGSVARNTAQPHSDIDILVDFDSSANAKRYFGVLFYLEDLLHCSVDLVTENALRPELRPFINQEMIVV